MKRILPLVVLSCALCLLAACGTQGAASSSAGSSASTTSETDSSSSLPADISETKLNDEEFEFHGVHLHLPNSIVLSEPNENQVISTSEGDKPITSEIWFDADVFFTDEIADKNEAISEEYDPIQAMLIYGLYSDDAPDEEVLSIRGVFL